MAYVIETGIPKEAALQQSSQTTVRGFMSRVTMKNAYIQ